MLPLFLFGLLLGASRPARPWLWTVAVVPVLVVTSWPDALLNYSGVPVRTTVAKSLPWVAVTLLGAAPQPLGKALRWLRDRPVLLLIAVCVLIPSARGTAQGSANFSGMWKLTKTDPPVAAGRGGGGRGGGISGPYAETTFNQAPETIAITQSGSDVTVQIGSAKAVFTLDGKTMSTPPGDVLALKTRAHWDGAALHLHYKQGMNWGRDILSVSGGTLTLVRDLESGGASTTRTLTYSKTS